MKITNFESIEDVIILDSHEYTRPLGTAREFTLDGNKYTLGIGYIQHSEGEAELLEISFTKI